MRSKNRLFLGVVTLSAVVAVCGQDNPAVASTSTNTLLITGGTLIDGTDAAPLQRSAILIQGDKIAAVGKAGEVKAPAGATVIDATGKFIIPGLIDGHVHYTDWTGELFLAHGVTSVIDLGNLTEWIIAVRDGVNKGKIRGPRIFTTGNFLNGVVGTENADSFRNTAFSGSRFQATRRSIRTVVTNVAEARQAAREIIAQGVDAIKVLQRLEPEQLRAIVEEAQKSNLAVVGHSDRVEESVKAGINGITHLSGISTSLMTPENRALHHKSELASPYAYMDPANVDKIIPLLVQNNVYVNPMLEHEHKAFTEWASRHEREDILLLRRPELNYIPLDKKLVMLAAYHRPRNYSEEYGSFPYLEYLPSHAREEFRKGYQMAQEFTRKFVASGGKLFLGTDSGGGAKDVPGLATVQEMQVLAASGIPLTQVLQSATKNIADLFHIDDKVGTIAPGRFADLVILTADPLADISNVRKIEKVFKNGELIDRSYHEDHSMPIPHPWGEKASNAFHPKGVINKLVPGVTVESNASDVSINIYGTSFLPQSTVTFNDIAIKSRFVDKGHLEATIPASFFSQSGTFAVKVINPPPGGGTSEEYGFIVSFQ